MCNAVLVAINAKYIHSNLAVYSLHSFLSDGKDQTKILEFTINQTPEEILASIYKKQPDLIFFSCYIWNIVLVETLVRELAKILPTAKIWLGGPEVSYDAGACLSRLHELTGVMVAEGETTFRELMQHYITGSPELGKILGIVYRSKNNIIATEDRPALLLSSLHFPYQDLLEEGMRFKNRILYYESSRGCPYSCSYCLSSIDKKIRFRDLRLVKPELLLFLSKKIPQVKFVDRTFNCRKSHAMEIWNFLKENDNGITNFHFEIAADLLGEEELTLLTSMRPGQIQLEIGVQSTNPHTLDAVNRITDLARIERAVNRLKKSKNIHLHLDLIAGLPYEDKDSFIQSFNQVYGMQPNQLQLGFLKVLKGSAMETMSEHYQIIQRSLPPYEILSNAWLSYDEILLFKSVESMLDIYYNSGQFKNSLRFLLHYFNTPFELYQKLAEYYEVNHWNEIGCSRIKRYEILLEFAIYAISYDVKEALIQILTYDLYLREKLKSRPVFALIQDNYRTCYRKFILENSGKGEFGDQLHLEHFTIDLEECIHTGNITDRESFVIFDYSKKDPLDHEAFVCRKDGLERRYTNEDKKEAIEYRRKE